MFAKWALAAEESLCMTTPKHQTAPGTSYFLTTKCWQGRPVFQIPENAAILIRTLFRYRERETYLLHEFVIMPDHLHLLLTPSATTSLEKVVQLIKGGSSHEIHRERNLKMEIWQEGFCDWTIRDADDGRTKAECIRMNPVRAKLVSKPEEWPHSSAAGRFSLDPTPSKYSHLASGAKAQIAGTLTPGLKPRPPKETKKTVEKSSFAVQTPNVGLKSPTPGAILKWSGK
jgi:putative transposase